MTTREYALLELMMQNQGRVVTRSMIAEKIWDTQGELTDNLIDVYMRRVRKKLDLTSRLIAQQSKAKTDQWIK